MKKRKAAPLEQTAKSSKEDSILDQPLIGNSLFLKKSGIGNTVAGLVALLAIICAIQTGGFYILQRFAPELLINIGSTCNPDARFGGSAEEAAAFDLDTVPLDAADLEESSTERYDRIERRQSYETSLESAPTLKDKLRIACLLLDLETAARISSASQRLRIRVACRWIATSYVAQLRGELACTGTEDTLCQSVAHFHSDCSRQMEHFEAQEAAWKGRCDADSGRSLPITRVRNLSYKDFIERYASRDIPVIVSGAEVDAFLPQKLDSALLSRLCGDSTVTVSERSSQGAFGLQKDPTDSGETDLEGFLENQMGEEAEVGPHRARAEPKYVFDWPISTNCPELLNEAIMPSYISTDYLQLFPTDSISEQWPSLLLGANGSGCALHIDSHASHFWMVLHSGRKRWRVYSRNDTPLLYPNEFKGSLGFDSLRANLTRYPLAGLASSYEFELQPGEMVLIPRDFPHQVDNLDHTIALAGNYIDALNYPAFRKDLEITAKAGKRFARSETQRLKWFDENHFEPNPIDLAQKPKRWNEYKNQFAEVPGVV